jgi:hypothetical protein
MKRSMSNERLFKQNLDVIDYLFLEFQEELSRVTVEGKKVYKATRKERLRRLRIEISTALKKIEDDLPSQYFVEVSDD